MPNAALKELTLQALGPALTEEILATEQQRLSAYHAALVRGWRDGSERFVMDIATDALSVVDYLLSRPDVSSRRIGAVGVSLGGMACWLLAACDERIYAAAPAIGVQSFRYALEHNLWGARVDSIRPVFDAAAKEIGKLDGALVEKVWKRISPGLAEADENILQAFDAPLTLPCVAPRPLLVLCGEKDPRCPLEGVHLAMARARKAYSENKRPGALSLFVDKGVEHEMTPRMWKEIDLFLSAWLLESTRSAL